jgi:hypothetical protein
MFLVRTTSVKGCVRIFILLNVSNFHDERFVRIHFVRHKGKITNFVSG